MTGPFIREQARIAAAALEAGDFSTAGDAIAHANTKGLPYIEDRGEVRRIVDAALREAISRPALSGALSYDVTPADQLAYAITHVEELLNEAGAGLDPDTDRTLTIVGLGSGLAALLPMLRELAPYLPATKTTTEGN